MQGRRPTDSELVLFNATEAVHTVPEQRRGQIVTWIVHCLTVLIYYE